MKLHWYPTYLQAEEAESEQRHNSQVKSAIHLLERACWICELNLLALGLSLFCLRPVTDQHWLSNIPIFSTFDVIHVFDISTHVYG